MLKNLGVPEADFVKCDRVRTAKAVKTLLAGCDGKEPTALVGCHRSCQNRNEQHGDGEEPQVCQGDLGVPAHAPDGICSRRSPDSGPAEDGRRYCLIQDVWSWLKTDEHALAGGLASKLSEAEGRAIKLLTPPKPVDRMPQLPHIDPLKPKPGWKQVGSGSKARLTNTESIIGNEVDSSEAGTESEAAPHRPMDAGGGVAMSVGTLSSQQLRSLVEDKWQQD